MLHEGVDVKGSYEPYLLKKLHIRIIGIKLLTLS